MPMAAGCSSDTGTLRPEQANSWQMTQQADCQDQLRHARMWCTHCIGHRNDLLVLRVSDGLSENSDGGMPLLPGFLCSICCNPMLPSRFPDFRLCTSSMYQHVCGQFHCRAAARNSQCSPSDALSVEAVSRLGAATVTLLNPLHALGRSGVTLPVTAAAFGSDHGISSSRPAPTPVIWMKRRAGGSV